MSGNVVHDWVMIATFQITEQEVEQVAAARVDPSGEGRADFQLTQEKMMSLDGPGCRACGLEWTVGYGISCAGQRPMSAPLPPQATEPPPSGLILPNGSRANNPGLHLPGQ